MESMKMKIVLIFFFALLLSTGCYAQNEQLGNFTPLETIGQQKKNKMSLTGFTTLESKEAVDPYTWDFGFISKDVVVKHEFEIKNNLDRVLNIKDISTSCGCTVSAAKKKVLEPGESTQITVEFNSKGYSGKVSQFVYVSTDDPDNLILKYTIKAFVQS